MDYNRDWESLEVPLSKPVLRTIKDLGFHLMTPVQVKHTFKIYLGSNYYDKYFLISSS